MLRTWPSVTMTNMSPNKPLVESAFQLVLSHRNSQFDILVHHTIPWPATSTTLASKRDDILPCVFVSSKGELLHLKNLSATLAYKIESAHEQSFSSEWHLLHRPRVTASRFCGVPCQRPELCWVIYKAPHEGNKADMRRSAAMEPVISAEFSRLMNVNYLPCGLVIHPTAPWLAASPDCIVFLP